MAGLLALIVLCLAASGRVLTAMSRSVPPAGRADRSVEACCSNASPSRRRTHCAGKASAFDALGKSSARLKTLTSGGQVKLEPALGKFNAAVTSVSDARASVETIQAANLETRELAPKLLSELGDLASAVGVQKLEGMSRYLERFENAVQRIQQELNGLASGVSDAAPTAQRLADSMEFLNQVVRGLSRAMNRAWRCRA